VQFCNINLPNPIGLAAGFDKNAEVLPGLFSLGFGFIEVGAVTPHPQKGNKKPRIFRLREDQAIINRLGFNNLGMHQIIHRLSTYKGDGKIGLNVGVNRTSPNKILDFVSVLNYTSPAVDFLTINVSSPNTEGLRNLQSKQDLIKLVKEVMRSDVVIKDHKPILLKIAPELNDEELKSIISICGNYGISGIIATNTTTKRPNLKSSHCNETGGLSGRPLFNISNTILAKLYYLSDGKIPIIGVGGVFSGQDAYKKICLGASVVQLYTALTYQGPTVVKKIITELKDLLDEEGYENISEAVGSKNLTYLMEETDRSIFG
jgi:dihydroorotate dehydrogenase